MPNVHSVTPSLLGQPLKKMRNWNLVDTDYIRRMTKAKSEPQPASVADAPCVFCSLRDATTIVMRNSLAFAVRDTTPVTALHTLVLPYRHAPTYFDLTEAELAAVNDLIWRLRSDIEKKDDASVKGFNVGGECRSCFGPDHFFHCHVHLIPRRKGDVQNPVGGVRAVIPDKMRY
ncbi:HIT family protein [Ancylobacter dichloromethanicus]